MLRSMFAAVSGLRSHQTMMDVTGNNVANVNTPGYKASRTTFQETLTQIVRGGSAGDAGAQGGVNPMQLGLGSSVASTDLVFTQGSSQLTGRPTDVAIQGEGFFVVQVGGEDLYMRAGAFSFDSEGHLVGPGGELVRGWVAPDPHNPADPNNPVPAAGTGPLETLAVDVDDFTQIAISADGAIVGRDANGELRTLGYLALARFANQAGLNNLGNGRFAPSPNSGQLVVDVPGTDGLGTLQGGMLEMANVDLAQEFTNLILAQRGFQANARTITASDELLQELVNIKR